MIMEMLANPQNPWLVQVAKKKKINQKNTCWKMEDCQSPLYIYLLVLGRLVILECETTMIE